MNHHIMSLHRSNCSVASFFSNQLTSEQITRLFARWFFTVLSKSFRVSRAHISILADFRITVISTVAILRQFIESLLRILGHCSIIIIIYSFRDFHISVSWWFFTGVRVTASLLKSPGLVSGVWPFSAILSFEWSLRIRQLPSPPSLLIIL